jgi:hypothetical protein
LKRFMVLYNSPVSASEMMANASPEQAKAGMDAWMAWAQQAGDALVDFGTPVRAAARISTSGVADGDSQATGYSLLQGDSSDDIEALLKNHPHLNMPGASIDVLEALPTPGS